MSEIPKIKISWEEVERVDAAAKPSEMGVATSQVPPGPPPGIKPAGWLWLVGGAAALFLILVVVAVGVSKKKGGDPAPAQTVEAWLARERPQWAGQISGSAEIKAFVENIHPWVTYKRAVISEMHAVTIDGSNIAGRQGENISEVEMLVTFYWEGPVTKDGFTEVRFNYDYQGQQFKGQRFERTNAKINLATVDWFKVGIAIGMLLF